MKYCIIKITPEDLEKGEFSYVDITKENLLCVKDRLKEAVEVYDRDITDKVKEIASELIHKSEKQHCQKNENNKGTITEDGSGDCQG